MQINFYLGLELSQKQLQAFADFEAANAFVSRLPDTEDLEDLKRVPTEVNVHARALEQGAGRSIEARATF